MMALGFLATLYTERLAQGALIQRPAPACTSNNAVRKLADMFKPAAQRLPLGATWGADTRMLRSPFPIRHRVLRGLFSLFVAESDNCTEFKPYAGQHVLEFRKNVPEKGVPNENR